MALASYLPYTHQSVINLLIQLSARNQEYSPKRQTFPLILPFCYVLPSCVFVFMLLNLATGDNNEQKLAVNFLQIQTTTTCSIPQHIDDVIFGQTALISDSRVLLRFLFFRARSRFKPNKYIFSLWTWSRRDKPQFPHGDVSVWAVMKWVGPVFPPALEQEDQLSASVS